MQKISLRKLSLKKKFFDKLLILPDDANESQTDHKSISASGYKIQTSTSIMEYMSLPFSCVLKEAF